MKYSPKCVGWRFVSRPLVDYIMDPANFDEILQLKILPTTTDLFTCSRLTVTLLLQHDIIQITDPSVIRDLYTLERVEWNLLNSKTIKKILLVREIPNLMAYLTIRDIIELNIQNKLNYPADFIYHMHGILGYELPEGNMPDFVCDDLDRPLKTIKNLIYLPVPQEVVVYILHRLFTETDELNSYFFAYMIEKHNLTRKNFRNAKIILELFPNCHASLITHNLLFIEDLTDAEKCALPATPKVISKIEDENLYRQLCGQFPNHKMDVENFKNTLYANNCMWQNQEKIELIQQVRQTRKTRIRNSREGDDEFEIIIVD